MESYQRPGDVLKATIEARGLTAYRVAKMAGLTRADPVQRFLSGERGLTLDTFNRLCQALDLRLVEVKRSRSSSSSRSAPDREK